MKVVGKGLANVLENNPDPDVLEALIRCGGTQELENVIRAMVKATPMVSDDADVSKINPDWAAEWRDGVKNCSDEDLANMWAEVLAGEVNTPNSYSRKTLSILRDMDKEDAEAFRTLCRFRLLSGLSRAFLGPTPPGQFKVPGDRPILAIRNLSDNVYSLLNDTMLQKMDELGLITMHKGELDWGVGYVLRSDSDHPLSYVCEERALICTLSTTEYLPVGQAKYTIAGEQLSNLCFPLNSPEGFADYITSWWEDSGVSVSNDVNKVMTITVEVYDEV